MPIITASIDPVTRIEGHLKIDIEIDSINGVQQVVEAKAIGTLYRGFEKILGGRDPRDATIITSRICGVCPTAHALCASMALDQLGGVIPNTAARLLRNLVHGACFLESHILHFYLLSLPDFIDGPAMAPWMPGLQIEKRLDPATSATLQSHYIEAITIRRLCHEMGAIWGGKLPHTPAFIGGGFTAVASADQVTAFRALLNQIRDFILGTYVPDVERLAALYPEYFAIGRGHGHLLSFGVYELDNAGQNRLFTSGRIENADGPVLSADPAAIQEHIDYSWYTDTVSTRNPAQGETEGMYPKPNAYTWLKAPRYQDKPYECGPLARMKISGHYSGGVSVLDRHYARAREAIILADAMLDWLNELPTETSAYTTCTIPQTGQSAGLTEAPRGALGHWVTVENKKIKRYQVITPTCWTVSPRDTLNQRGPLEEALIGTPIHNAAMPVEALRVIHSVDPCLDCATHVVEPGTLTGAKVLS